jgi:hypothetical protein
MNTGYERANRNGVGEGAAASAAVVGRSCADTV